MPFIENAEDHAGTHYLPIGSVNHCTSKKDTWRWEYPLNDVLFCGIALIYKTMKNEKAAHTMITNAAYFVRECAQACIFCTGIMGSGILNDGQCILSLFVLFLF